MNVLFNWSRKHNIKHCTFYRGRVTPHVSWVDETKAFDALATELGGLYRSVEGTLKKAEKKKKTLDAKAVVGCELGKKLDIVRDTFLDLKRISNDVVVMEAGLTKITDKLQVKAKALGTSDVAMENTQHIRYAAD
ncbi:hypothetical protein ERJ75_000849500 [Trypanosoma vivax]|nr:hypothetical protein TRVL_09990 [Trypanosoma vivax]KAH8612829.1 hypothetical protein ERJ75_000849500 [Trypanosoma vivax]